MDLLISGPTSNRQYLVFATIKLLVHLAIPCIWKKEPTVYSTLIFFSLVLNSSSQTPNSHLWSRVICSKVLQVWFSMKITNRFNARPALRFSFKFSTHRYPDYPSVTINVYLQLFYSLGVIGLIKSTCSFLQMLCNWFCALYEDFCFYLATMDVFHTRRRLSLFLHFA